MQGKWLAGTTEMALSTPTADDAAPSRSGQEAHPLVADLAFSTGQAWPSSTHTHESDLFGIDSDKAHKAKVRYEQLLRPVKTLLADVGSKKIGGYIDKVEASP